MRLLDDNGIRVHRPDEPQRVWPFRDVPPRRATTWQSVAVLAVLVLGAVGMAWACAWGVRG